MLRGRGGGSKKERDPRHRPPPLFPPSPPSLSSPADAADAVAALDLVSAPAKPAGLFGGLFGGVTNARAVPFDPADMRALDWLAGSLKTTGVLNK